MGYIAILILPFALWPFLGWGGATLGSPKVTEATIQAFFSPHGRYTEAIVEALGQARNTVRVQACSFTSVLIAKALVDAHKPGAGVKMFLDKIRWKEKSSLTVQLVIPAIPTRIETQYPILLRVA